MNDSRGVLLTGATGLLGRFLLRDLLASGRPVGVLVRDGGGRTAAERLDELLAWCGESQGRTLPRPVLLDGDLRTPGLGLGAAARQWLARRAGAVVHSAACVAYQPTPDGEPWETNVNGTYRLLEVCRGLGMSEVHHVSTAFVCGDRRGTAYENELDLGEGSGNAYEQSKYAAEQMLGDFAGLRTTVYRPSIVVGDSGTGYTSTYHHFYRFLELAVRLAGPRRGRANLGLRLPLTGEERQNFVPVDWVSRALVELVRRPELHGRTYHLVARRSVRLREVTDLMRELLHLDGIRWVGPGGVDEPSVVERMVLEQFEDYWSYLRSGVVFDDRNTRRALPDLPPPAFDRELMARLLRFAQADGWGRQRGGSSAGGNDLGHYLERVLPVRMRQSPLAAALPAGLSFALDVRGPGGGLWSCRCGDGTLDVRRDAGADAALTYRLDVPTLRDLIRGRRTAQQAFFDGHIEIDGDTEKALKLALLIEQFLAEGAAQPTEEPYAAAGR